MKDVDTVFYCIVDARAWLRDPSPLHATNVEALRTVLDVAVEVGVPKFVFCSSVVTIAIAESGLADEAMPHNWRHLGGAYIESRIQAEELVLGYHRDHGLPAVVLNVATTYGPRDHGPTPHGNLVKAAAQGKVPAYAKGVSMEVVGIEDAASAPSSPRSTVALVSGTSSPRDFFPSTICSPSPPTRAVPGHRRLASRSR